MRRFLAVERDLGERKPLAGDGPDLSELLSWTGWEDWAGNTTTNDPAQWHDWLTAVRSTTAP